MTDMLNDPATMTPIERRREIAAILARGVLRVRQDRACEHGSQPSRTVKKLRNPAKMDLNKWHKRALMDPRFTTARP